MSSIAVKNVLAEQLSATFSSMPANSDFVTDLAASYGPRDLPDNWKATGRSEGAIDNLQVTDVDVQPRRAKGGGASRRPEARLDDAEGQSPEAGAPCRVFGKS